MLIALLGTPACGSFIPVETAVYHPELAYNPAPEPAGVDLVQPETPAEQPVLLFGIGMHIEPFGSNVSDLVSGFANKQPQGGSQNSRDYHQIPFFERHFQDIQIVAEIIEDHGGMMTVQAQTPFTQIALDSDNSILELTGIQPWRPSGVTDGYNIQAFTQHDPNSAVVYLPEGLFDRNDFASMRRGKGPDGEHAYFDYMEKSLLASLAAAESGQVNVFHFTIHPTEFHSYPNRPYELIECFLAEIVDPLVESGRIRWATFSDMADAYQEWESKHPLFSITAQESY